MTKGKRSREDEEPLFSFGHGLGYTGFAHEGLEIVQGERLTAGVSVRNTGSRAGADVPQVYLVDAAGAGSPALGLRQARTVAR